MDAFSSGTKELNLSLADDHPAGVLPEVARQAINRLIEPNERRHAGMRLGQTRLLNLRLEIERVREIAMGERDARSGRECSVQNSMLCRSRAPRFGRDK